MFVVAVAWNEINRLNIDIVCWELYINVCVWCMHERKMEKETEWQRRRGMSALDRTRKGDEWRKKGKICLMYFQPILYIV